MDSNIFLTILEFISSLVMEGVVLGLVFQLVSNKSTRSTAKSIENELGNVERQNKLIFELLQQQIKDTKIDIISQIKESKQNN